MPAHDSLVVERLQVLLTACDVTPASGSDEAMRQFEDLMGSAEPSYVWLARAVLGADLPGHEEMSALLRDCRLFGPREAFQDVFGSLRDQGDVRVQVARASVTCDVQNTASSSYVSGIQRVVRAVSRRWAALHDVRFVSWDEDERTMLALSDEQQDRMFGSVADASPTRDVVVPWKTTHLVPEVFIHPDRCDRIFTLAKYSGCSVGVIGYDCIPMTTASSVAPGMSAAFGSYLAACRQVTRVAAISGAAAAEYRGWKRMLAGVRETGPEVAAIALPVAAHPPSEEALAAAGRRLGLTRAPMILVVGSHEPRKNHLAVLHAAESLWREGLRFSLVIAGAGSWQAQAYHREVAALTAAGRPVLSISGLSDDLLWAAYRLAHCTLFPSLNEGFGLPVAESLAAGTPVITSNFGSTRDIVAPRGEPWGGLLVDPHDDEDIAGALRRMLTEPETHARLTAEISQHDLGSWDDYAEQVWRFLVGEEGAE